MSKNSDLMFTWNLLKNGKIEEVELIDKGGNIAINEENKGLFVDKV
jgi:hypothetical protein